MITFSPKPPEPPLVEVAVTIELPMRLLQAWRDEGTLCTNLGDTFKDHLDHEAGVYAAVEPLLP